jgi:hypothetical protein
MNEAALERVLRRFGGLGQPDDVGQCDGCGDDRRECWWFGWWGQWQLCSECCEEWSSAVEEVLSDDPTLVGLLLAEAEA